MVFLIGQITRTTRPLIVGLLLATSLVTLGEGSAWSEEPEVGEDCPLASVDLTVESVDEGIDAVECGLIGEVF